MTEKEKVTTMVLNVDLQCSKCYKKVKKLLCKFPQIRDQEYDEKANKVTIKVVCCSPEKIRDKLCNKGRGSIKSIEIKEPEKKQKTKSDQPPEKKQEEQTKPDSEKEKKEAEDSKEPKDDGGKQPITLELDVLCCDECYSGRPGGPCRRGGSLPVPVPVPVPVPSGFCCDECYGGRPGGPCWRGEPPPAPVPLPWGFCCDECYSGRPGGPCWRGGRVQPDGYYGRPVFDSWGGCGSGRANYCTEEIQQGCTIM